MQLDPDRAASLLERGRLRAALIPAGSSAVLSHWTAAALWRLTPSMPPFVEVTVTRKGPRSRQGLNLHETRRPPDVRILDSLPLTAPLRTLIGWDFHGHRAAFENDRARDAYLAARGWIVVRVTWRQLRDSPMLVMTQLAQTLALRASTPVRRR